MCCICKEKKYIFAELRKFFKSANRLDLQIANQHITNPQITTMIGSKITNSLSATFAEGPQNKKIVLSLQTCGFAICGTYLRAFANELWKLKKIDCD
jgi:hypothetical protein